MYIIKSCLEQSLFRDHFGPDGGPSVCLRVLKVLRDMTGFLVRLVSIAVWISVAKIELMKLLENSSQMNQFLETGKVSNNGH